MQGYEYQTLAMRTNDGRSSERLADKLTSTTHAGWADNDISIGGLIDGCLGLAGETGEFNDMVKKWIFHEKPLDEEHLMKELSDCMWYVAMICDAMGWNLDKVMEINIDKLKARYPQGFDVDLANNRKEGDV